MSDGQLLVRMRAWEREKTWGPEFVGNELSGTHQAADARRRDAALRRAEADATVDEDEREKLLQKAADADALADVLVQRSAELETADEARAVWYAHTAETRAAADRARLELAARNVDTVQPEPVTAAEWLNAHREHLAVEDVHREITDEADFADVAEERRTDLTAVDHEPVADAAETTVDVVETEVADIRDTASAEEPVFESEEVRVPPAEESAESIERAQRALREIEARQAVEDQHAAEEAQAAEMYRRNTADAAEAAATADDAVMAR